MEKYHGKVRTQRYTFGGKNPGFYSQGLLMSLDDFKNDDGDLPSWLASLKYRINLGKEIEHEGLTEILGVTYLEVEDNKRKAKTDPNAKYKSMMSRHPKLARSKFGRWCMKHDFAKKILFLFMGNKKKDTGKDWPVGKFPGVSKTDQERCENIAWILEDKTPFIVTQKCDGSSGTYILERKSRNKFEFYVCSRNVRMKEENQECFFGSDNYYWEVAKKYDIENKMKDWLLNHSDATFVCWQGEICAPRIQKNPHKLSETHFYCFHWTDSINGRMSIIEAAKVWKKYNMEVVPIICENYILPNDFEEFKQSADGYYNPSVCEGQKDCVREGFVYYKTTDPTFSFKNVSRKYLLNH
jgi:hypothetical protein